MKSVSFLNQWGMLKHASTSKNHSPILSCVIVLAALFTLSACSGGSGGSTPEGDPSSLIPGGPVGGDASGVADDQLQKMAASRAGAGLGVNLSSLSRLSDDAQNDLGTDSPVGGFLSGGDSDTLDTLDSTNIEFLNNTLGIDDPGAKSTRVGNIITIDPDDQSICADEIPLAADVNDDLMLCQQLVADLMVEINALTDESGVITYLFQDGPVLRIGYSPAGASYEINLSGLQRVTSRIDELNGFTSAETPIVSGTLRLVATVLNSEAGSEAGTVSLKVTEALRLGSTGTQAGISLQPSTIFELAFDEAAGDVSMGVNWGALQLMTASGDSNGNTSTSTVNLGALTGELNFNENQPTFQFKNVGIGNVPLTITIDSVESVNFTLASFGITVDSDTGMINLDGALNASLMLDNMAGLLEDQARGFTASASVSAPAGTSFLQQDNGSTLLSTGGPLSATLIGGDGITSGQSEVSINAGDCFGSADESEDSNRATSVIAALPCN